MSYEMKADVELLRDLIDDESHNLSVKRLAHLTDLAKETVYAYINGRINIPLCFWASVLQHTHDLRIVELLTRHSEVDVFLRNAVPNLDGDETSIRAALESIEKFHAMQKYLTKALADGEINQKDTDAVKQFNQHYVEFIAHSHAVHRAVNKAFRAAIAGAAS
ncbi:MAG TPA: hypothetical protein ENI79_03145 [Rhodospirillales bacterium]|mgnify:CR=1 FL=1|nr:hypothetical protein [Rhodospirillales bacterium]